MLQSPTLEISHMFGRLISLLLYHRTRSFDGCCGGEDVVVCQRFTGLCRRFEERDTKVVLVVFEKKSNEMQNLDKYGAVWLTQASHIPRHHM
jgi:hypothetical protein